MKKVLVDLDVVTVATWHKKSDRKQEAIEFLNECKKGKYIVSTPFSLIGQLSAWKNKKLATDTVSELFQITTEFIDNLEAKEKIESITFKKFERTFNDVVKEGSEIGVKESDLRLVLHASAANAKYLVTFNKKHLKNKAKEINSFLEKYGLHSPKIVLPSELKGKGLSGLFSVSFRKNLSDSHINKSVDALHSFGFFFGPQLFDFVSNYFRLVFNFRHKPHQVKDSFSVFKGLGLDTTKLIQNADGTISTVVVGVCVWR